MKVAEDRPVMPAMAVRVSSVLVALWSLLALISVPPSVPNETGLFNPVGRALYWTIVPLLLIAATCGVSGVVSAARERYRGSERYILACVGTITLAMALARLLGRD